MAGYGFNNFFFRGGYSLYKHEFRPGSCLSLNLFYQFEQDSTTNFRVELEYLNQNLGLMYKVFTGHASGSYLNMDYKLQQARLNLDYYFRLNKIQHKNRLDLITGFSFGYILEEKSTGEGWKTKSYTYTDTLGNTYSSTRNETYSRNNQSSNDIDKFQFGIDLGLEYCVNLNEKTSLLFQNKYLICFSSVIIYTPLLKVGIRYKIGTKTP